jgi:hypothetical protein
MVYILADIRSVSPDEAEIVKQLFSTQFATHSKLAIHERA